MPYNDKGRDIYSRWVVVGNLTLETATCLGGNDDSLVDTSILKDSLEGKPLLPGSTLSGAIRSKLRAMNVDTKPLFGGESNDDNGDQSSLIVFDSIASNKPEIEFRDGVKIKPESGIAEDNCKFDYEVIPAGTIFPARFELIVPSEAKEKELVSLLYLALRSLSNISLGFKKSRGLGKLKFDEIKVKRYSMNIRDGAMEWLLSDYLNPLKGITTAFRVDNIKNELEKILGISIEKEYYNNCVLSFSADFTIPDGVSIRSSGKNADDPDSVHLTSNGKPIISGTSLAGSLRHQALRIANTVKEGNGKTWVNKLFGPDIKKGQKNINAHISKIKVSESFLEGGEDIRVSRIKIDRFTQGVYPGALFDEQINRNGKFSVELILEDKKITDAEKGLFLLLIKDLVDGVITIGGSSSIGRGRVEAVKDSLKMLNGSKEMKLWDNAENEDTQLADEWIKAFINAKNITETSAIDN